MAIYKEDIVSIELENGVIHRSFLNHSIGSGDAAANRFGIRVFRNGSEVDLSGVSCQAYFQNAEGTNIALTSYGTVSGNVAYVTLPQACYNVEGQFCLAIKLIGGGVTGTMRIIDGMVCNTGTTGAVAPTSSVPTYQEILSTYAAMVSATSAANLAIADEFDASENYPAGKNVINDGALYVLPNGHTAGTTWANTTKVASNLGDQVTDLKSALDYLKEDQLQRYLDNYIVLTGTEKKAFSIPPGTIYTIDTFDGSPFPTDFNFVDFFDSNDTRIDYAGFNSTIPNPRTISYEGSINNPLVCLRLASDVPIVIKYTNTNKISSVVDKYTEYLETAGVVTPNDLEAQTTGWYINNEGTTTANANYKITNPISLKKGDILLVTCQAASGNVSVISEKLQYVYRPLVISDEAAVKTYTYVAEKDISVKVCCTFKKTNYAVVIKPTSEEKQTVPYSAIFHRIGVIGDSLSSGELTYKVNDQWVFVDKYEYSWLSNIARTLGLEKAHYSQGGYTAKDFVDDSGGHKTRLLNDTACNAYYIALGTNDKNQSYPLGTISDTKDTASFVGYMKNIIDVVHTKAPNAVIFLLSTYNDWNETNVSYSEIIEDISELYNYCFYLDFQKASAINTQTEGIWSAGGHFSTAGYVYVANIILELTNKAVMDNGEYFFYFALNN